MTTVIECRALRAAQATDILKPDLANIKQRQQATWSAGDYAVIGTTLQIVGERLARGKERADAERLLVTFRHADAEALPFENGAFDVALSTFGVMFTPNQQEAAAELVRVVRKGGRIGLASWTPDGFIGQLFQVIAKYVSPPAGINSPALWGTERYLRELFPGQKVEASKQIFNFRYTSAEHWLKIFKNFYGPTNRAFRALDSAGQSALSAEITALLEQMNRGGKNSLVVPGEYLEAVVTIR